MSLRTLEIALLMLDEYSYIVSVHKSAQELGLRRENGKLWCCHLWTIKALRKLIADRKQSKHSGFWQFFLKDFSEKAHAALLVCPYSQHWIFSNSMSKSVENQCNCKSRTLATKKQCFIKL